MQLAWIVLKAVVGGALIAVGIVMIPLPGPGLPLIVGGIALLATEFEWAANLQERMRELYRRVRPARA